MDNAHFINIAVTINASIEKVWDYFTNPMHITRWYFASEDWCAPSAINDLKIGGVFRTRMESKDGTMGFDFNGKYTNIEMYKIINYILEDNRIVKTTFKKQGNICNVSQSFEPEIENTLELQKNGWQAILNNFKLYTENN